MPLKFSYVCDLLDDLEALEQLHVPLLQRDKALRYHDTVKRWFNYHRRTLDAHDTNLAALLSCLLPERRTDRMYGMQHTRLANVISGALGLGRASAQRLKALPDGSDFATSVAATVDERGAGIPSSLSVEQLDKCLGQLAAICRFSSPKVRQAMISRSPPHQHEILKPIFQRLAGREIKWVLRIIFKRLAPLNLEEYMILRNVHGMFPAILKVNSDFVAALEILNSPELASLTGSCTTMSSLPNDLRICLKPQTGVKVGRPTFKKARSIKHCLQMVDDGKWHIEPKYDGEYCQVHVDLDKGQDCIQLFSKSGKDSTADRAGLHAILRAGLRIGKRPGFTRRCILEGEMVVFDTRDNKPLDFHKIRKHVSRSGSFLGTTQDSVAHAHEQLGMIFYDAMLIDDDAVMHQPYEVRRSRLKQLVDKVPGQICTADWGTINFAPLQKDPKRAERHIFRLFAKAMAKRCEGLILKPDQGAYLSLGQNNKHDGTIIKMKADYIPGMGDTSDFAVVGAAYKDDHGLPLHMAGDIKWTHFYIACLANKEEYIRYQARPVFKTMDVLSGQFLSYDDKVHMSQHGQYMVLPWDEEASGAPYDLRLTGPDHKGKILFRSPFVVEVLGSSFDKPPSSNHYMLRHARITKVHADRGLEDVVSFDKLQESALHARQLPVNQQEEEEHWMRRLQEVSKPKRGSDYVTRSSPFSTKTSSCPDSSRTSPSSVHRLRTRAQGPAKPSPQGQGHLSINTYPANVSPLRQRSSITGTVPTDDSPLRARARQESRPTLIRLDTNELQVGDNRYSPANPIITTKKRRADVIIEVTRSKRAALEPDMFTMNEARKGSHAGRRLERGVKLSVPATLQEKTQALADIDIAPSPYRAETGSTSKAKILQPATQHRTQMSPQTQQPTTLAPLDSLPSGLNHGYLFRRYTILLSPCLQPIKLLTEGLLPLFRPEHTTDNVELWKRDLPPAAEPLGPVVADSQSFERLEKALFVEVRLKKATDEAIREAMKVRLAPGKEIQVWDWRILERITEIEKADPGFNPSQMLDMLEHCLIGVIRAATNLEFGAIDDFDNPDRAIEVLKRFNSVTKIQVTDDRVNANPKEGPLMPNLFDTGSKRKKEIVEDIWMG